jgi:hypothetical protein
VAPATSRPGRGHGCRRPPGEGAACLVRGAGATSAPDRKLASLSPELAGTMEPCQSRPLGPHRARPGRCPRRRRRIGCATPLGCRVGCRSPRGLTPAEQLRARLRSRSAPSMTWSPRRRRRLPRQLRGLLVRSEPRPRRVGDSDQRGKATSATPLRRNPVTIEDVPILVGWRSPEPRSRRSPPERDDPLDLIPVGRGRALMPVDQSSASIIAPVVTASRCDPKVRAAVIDPSSPSPKDWKEKEPERPRDKRPYQPVHIALVEEHRRCGRSEHGPDHEAEERR